MGILDAIGKFEISEPINVWFGRMLVPTERGELNGPFYHAVYDGFRTPLNPADFSTNFGAGGAGMYGRDNGVTFFGKIHPGGTHVQYAAGIFTGTRSGAFGGPGPNLRNSLKYAGRLTWNLLNEEKNPGYYTSGTYYGTAGDILAIAVGGEYQNAAAGSLLNPAPFGAVVSDLLFEKVLPNNNGVFTFNAEYKRYWSGNLASHSDATTAPGFSNFPIFAGTSVTAYALYLFPQEVGIGRFQPYGRYTFVNGVHSSALDEFEAGVNYVIAGHNARISSWWRHGNIAPTSPGYPAFTGIVGANNPHQDSFQLALQLQY